MEETNQQIQETPEVQSPNGTESKSSRRWYLLLLLVVIILALFFISKGLSQKPTTITVSTPSPTATQSTSKAVEENVESAVTGEEGTSKEFVVTGSNYKFDVKEIKVKAGETVKITFKNTVGEHDFVLDEFKVSTKVLAAGEEETITFVASKPGTYEYYCSVGSHRKMGMVGKLVVE